jgi:hypothetical protein
MPVRAKTSVKSRRMCVGVRSQCLDGKPRAAETLACAKVCSRANGGDAAAARTSLVVAIQARLVSATGCRAPGAGARAHA